MITSLHAPNGNHMFWTCVYICSGIIWTVIAVFTDTLVMGEFKICTITPLFHIPRSIISEYALHNQLHNHVSSSLSTAEVQWW